MRLIYHPQAAEELIEASGFYERRVMGLGSRFLDAVEDSLAKLSGTPQLAPADDRGRRKYLIHGFPYVIIYWFESDSLHVLAVAHTGRKPGYWAARDTAAL